MGLTHVTVALGNLKADGILFEAEFLVDTGAVDCLAPALALTQAGFYLRGVMYMSRQMVSWWNILAALPVFRSWGPKQ